MGICFLFSLPFASLLFSVICKISSTTILPLCTSFLPLPRERRPGVQPTPGEHWGSGFRPLGPKAAPEFGVESLTLASLSRDEGDHHPAALVRRTAPPSPPIFPSGWFPLHVLSQTEEVFGGKCPLFMGGLFPPQCGILLPASHQLHTFSSTQVYPSHTVG